MLSQLLFPQTESTWDCKTHFGFMARTGIQPETPSLVAMHRYQLEKLDKPLNTAKSAIHFDIDGNVIKEVTFFLLRKVIKCNF